MAEIKKIRVNMNLNEDLVKKIDDYAKKIGLNRTGATALLLNMCFKQLENEEKEK